MAAMDAETALGTLIPELLEPKADNKELMFTPLVLMPFASPFYDPPWLKKTAGGTCFGPTSLVSELLEQL